MTRMVITEDGIEVFDRPLTGHGGARPGAGKKPAGYVKPQEAVDYDKARARNEQAKAELNELELKVKQGEFAPRASFRQAAATAMAATAQTLRSIPDNLERKLGISAEIAEEVAAQIDAALNDLADEFQMMCSDAE